MYSAAAVEVGCAGEPQPENQETLVWAFMSSSSVKWQYGSLRESLKPAITGGVGTELGEVQDSHTTAPYQWDPGGLAGRVLNCEGVSSTGPTGLQLVANPALRAVLNLKLG